MLGLTGIPLLCASNLANMQTHAAMYGILHTDWQLHIYIGQYIQIDLCMIQERETERECYVLFLLYTAREACWRRASLLRHSFDSGPSTALRSLNDPLCMPDSEHKRLLLGIESPLYTMCTQQRVQNLAFAIRKHTKTMVSIFARLGICAALFSDATNCQPPTSSWHSSCGGLY